MTEIIRGDVNAILNGLIREGVITGFETNSGAVSEWFALHVRVTADVVTDQRNPTYDERRVRSIRNRVAKDIEPLAPGVIVSVRATIVTAAPKPASVPPPSGSITGEQCRAGRRLLGWPLAEHARVAGVRLRIIGAFERSVSVPQPATLAAIIGALEKAGVEFTDDAPDVRLRID